MSNISGGSHRLLISIANMIIFTIRIPDKYELDAFAQDQSSFWQVSMSEILNEMNNIAG